MILTLAVFPNFVNALAAFVAVSPGRPDNAWSLALLAFASLQVIAPLLLIMSRTPGGLPTFAKWRYRLVQDSLWTVGTFVAVLIVPMLIMIGLEPVLWPILSEFEPTHATVHSAPVSLVGWSSLIFVYVISAAAEELALRAYLITRLSQLGLHRINAVLVSSAVFASYHIYQGAWATVQVFLMGAVFGTVFALSRRFWPLVLSHTGANIVATLSVV